MRVAVIGSDKFRPLRLVSAYIKALPSNDIVVSGGGSGVDRIAELTAKKRGLGVEIILGDWRYLNKATGTIRSSQVVSEADRVVVFWDKKSRGTPHTIGIAQKMNKEIIVYGTQGEILYDSNRPPIRTTVH